MLIMKNSSLWKIITRKTKLAVLIHDYTDSMSGQLPCELDIGDGVDFLFKISEDCFLSEGWTHIGVKDSFSRIHWAPKRNVSVAKKSYLEKFKQKNS